MKRLPNAPTSHKNKRNTIANRRKKKKKTDEVIAVAAKWNAIEFSTKTSEKIQQQISHAASFYDIQHVRKVLFVVKPHHHHTVKKIRRWIYVLSGHSPQFGMAMYIGNRMKLAFISIATNKSHFYCREARLSLPLSVDLQLKRGKQMQTLYKSNSNKWSIEHSVVIGVDEWSKMWFSLIFFSCFFTLFICMKIEFVL